MTEAGSDENENAGLVKLTEMTMPAAAKNLYPVLFRYPVKVVLDAEETELEEGQPNKLLLDCGETLDMTLMNRAWKAGYGLVGWYSTNGTKWDETKQIDPAACDMDETGNPLLTEESGKRYFYYTMTLEPRWALRWTNVLYDLNGGTGEADNEIVLPGGLVRITEDVPTAPAAKEFAGWTDRNGHLYQAKQQFEYKNLDAVTETGKEFYDWTGAAQGGPPAGEHNTIKLTAVYRPLSADTGLLVFTNAKDVKDASVVRPVEVTIPANSTEVQITIAKDGKSFTVTQGEETIETRTVPTRTGYRFTGWSLTEDGSAAIGADDTVSIKRNTEGGTSSTTVYSMWTEQEYTITFRTNGGTEIPTANYAYKAKINEANHQTSKLHHTFAGWKYLGEGENIQPHSLPETMPAEDLTVEVIWMPVLYKMVFKDGEEECHRIESAFGTAVSEPVDPKKDGYVFVGWTLNGNDIVSLPTTMPGEDRTYQAKWLRQQTPPPAPKVTEETPVTITVEKKAGQEYSIDGGDSWQTEDTFTGLTPDTTYSIVTRMAATAEAATSEKSEETKATTQKYPQEAPAAPGVKATQTTIEVTTVTEGQQYAIDGTENWVNPDDEGRMVFTGLLPGTEHRVYARWAETKTQYVSPASEPVIVITGTTKIFVVYEDERGNWPAEAPAEQADEAAGFYNVPEKADATLIPEGTDPEGFTVTGYSAEYSTETRTATLPGTRVILQKEQENLYIYYARNKYSLTFYEDIAGTKELQTYEVRYGETLGNDPEIAGKKVNKEGFAFTGWAKSAKAEGNYSYQVTETGSIENERTGLVNFNELTMPAEAMDLYPVLFRYPVKVVLDAEEAEMEAGLPKKILLDCGETLDMTLMNRAWKAGYGLAGWYTTNGTKWDENMQIDPAACNMDEAGNPLLTEEEEKRYFYYTMTLVPRWALRWTNVVYDLNGGTGEADNEIVLPGGLVRITEDVPTAPAEKEFAGWTDRNGHLYQANQQFEYKNLDAVTETGKGFYNWKGAAPGGPPAGEHNTIKLTAVYKSLSADAGWLVFTNAGNINDASVVRPVEVTIPGDSTEVRIKIAADGKSFTVTQGEETVGTRTVPTRTGYRLTGWSLTEDGSAAIGTNDTVTIKRNTEGGTSSTTVYAMWTEQEYTITFQTNGGKEIPTANYAYQANINEANHQTSKLHNTFAGWRYLGEDENTQPHSLPANMPAEDLTVEAIWTPVLYKMIFKDGEDECHRIEAAFGTAISEPKDPKKDRNIFIGWTLNGNDIVSLPATMPGEDRTYQAKWLTQQTTPQDPPNVTGITPTTITVETIAGQEYSIDGGDSWQTEDTFTGLTPNTAYSIVTRMAATANAAASEMSPETKTKTTRYPQKAPAAPGVKATQTTIEVTTVTEGQQYAIDGTEDWVKPDKEGRVVFTGLLPGTEHRVYARWAETPTQETSPASEPQNATTHGEISYEMDNQNAPEISGFKALTPEDVLEIAENTVTGAKARQRAGEAITMKIQVKRIDTPDDEEKKLAQEALKNVYARNLEYLDITIWLQIGTDEPVQVTNLGKHSLKLEMTVPNGYRPTGNVKRTFHVVRIHDGEGTILKSSQEYIFDFESELFSTYALGSTGTATITFETDGGSTINPITQESGTDITAPAAPTKEGYTFLGWDTPIPEKMPAEDLTITAKWKINQYTITFNMDGGSEIKPITQDYDTKITAPADPTKTGYTFIRWDKKIPETMPAEDITVTAEWKINQYTIVFVSDGGSAIAPITQDYGTKITKPANPTRTNYTFTGWDPAIPETMPAENLKIKAQWKLINGKGVNTGDDFNMPLWIAMLALLILGLAGFNLRHFRTKRRTKSGTKKS